MTGHNIADLDPLGINEADLDSSIPPELQLHNAGISYMYMYMYMYILYT